MTNLITALASQYAAKLAAEIDAEIYRQIGRTDARRVQQLKEQSDSLEVQAAIHRLMKKHKVDIRSAIGADARLSFTIISDTCPKGVTLYVEAPKVTNQ